MDEKEKELEEFSLEDILKEFGDSKEEDPAPQLEEDVRLWGEEAPETVSQPPVQDTVRLDEITKAVRQMEETVSDETVRFTPVGGDDEDEPLPEAIPLPEDKVEPYSEEWEPEYEQPIVDYIPPEPIVFRPKSRLQELKKKLVEGPERRYYELAEKGLGKLQFAIILNLIVAALAAGSAAVYALGMVSDNRHRLLVFGQFLFLMLSALLGSYQLIEGFTDMIRKRFSLNSLLIFSFLACCADAVLCLKLQRIPCCAAFSLTMTMSLWSSYQKRKTETQQMDTMRKAIVLDSVVGVEDYYEGRPGFLRTEGNVEDFMDHYNEIPGPEKTFSAYALAALIVSLGIGVTAGVLHSVAMGVQSFSAALLVAVPATSYITLSRPMALLERRLHKLGSVICGWQGVKGLSRPAVFPVGDLDVFPSGTIKLNGVKFYGSREPDEVVAYSAALICADGGGMAPLFSRLLDSRNGYHYDTEEIRGYAGGIGGVVNGEAVLAGTSSFLQSMGVEMPEGARVSQAVYVAIDGTLCGVFAITYSKVKSAATGLTTLCAYRRLTPVLTAGDFMLTEGLLRSKFGINTRRMAFPDRNMRMQLAEHRPEEDAPALAMTTAEGLASTAYTVTGARALRSASVTGVVIHMLGGILGLLIVLALTLVDALYLLTPANILLYELIWMIPGILITEWTRSV